MSRSIMKASRAMYPVSSSNPMKKKRMRICGRKTKTPATPAMAPSMIRLRRSPSGMMPVTQPASPPTSRPHSSPPLKTASIQPIGASATLKISVKIMVRTVSSAVHPQTRCSRMASSRSVSESCWASGRRTTSSHRAPMASYRAATKRSSQPGTSRSNCSRTACNSLRASSEIP